MSTKAPLKSGRDPKSGCSFELYDDWLARSNETSKFPT
jgi:hypothetical protein